MHRCPRAALRCFSSRASLRRLTYLRSHAAPAHNLGCFASRPRTDICRCCRYAALHGEVSYEYAGARKVPVVGLRFSLWSDGEHGADGEKVGVAGAVNELVALQAAHRDPTSPLSYSIVGVELGQFNYSSIVEVVAQLESRVPGGFDFVLPETLVAKLVALTKGEASCPLASGPWARAAGDLPKCSVDNGDGKCVMTCANLGTLTRPARPHDYVAKLGDVPLPTVSCDLNVCSKGLALSPTRLAFLCSDGSKCPAA